MSFRLQLGYVECYFGSKPKNKISDLKYPENLRAYDDWRFDVLQNSKCWRYCFQNQIRAS